MWTKSDEIVVVEEVKGDFLVEIFRSETLVTEVMELKHGIWLLSIRLRG
ncbi:hypothetical protein N007_15565 [Alicyclobacillus acidoterrestris ATCC 49025]|nr:hypothetical protein N007_15565 [Alicyclobacillus acidoterrestris ATCC 49025]